MFPSILRILLIPAAIAPVASLAADYPNTSSFGNLPVDHNAAWYQRCLAVEHVEPPAADLPVSVPPQCAAAYDPFAPLAGSAAIKLYYDTKFRQGASAAEWKQVRDCAFASSNKPVLMMLFANGYGVARNLDLATRYACSLEFQGPAELEYRVGHLSGHNGAVQNFDFCDDITSGASMAICADLRETQRAKVRQAALDRYAQTLAPAARTAFSRLRQSQAQFAATSEKEESDWHGTGAAADSLEARGRLDAQFEQDIQHLDKRAMPHYSAMEYAELDNKLNRTYRAVIQTPSKQADEPGRLGDSTVTRDGVRKAERAWRAYRDAWAAFVLATTGTDPTSVQALLTERRIRQLAGIPL